ncbi:MAG: hypothetical protein JRE19_17610 [Deltaproteobacteria bacterium]|nr:hypothetical protein [Deltaproteobacteria bacterium]
MRDLLRVLCVCALGVGPLVGCGETAGAGGGAGSAGTGGAGGDGGTGGVPACRNPEDCDDGKECTEDTCVGGTCDTTPVEDFTLCDNEGVCLDGVCWADGVVFECTEQGIRSAIAAGGGPYTFNCERPTTVVTEAEIVIDNDVILRGDLTVDGNDDHRVFSVADGVTAELRGFTVTKGLVGGQEHGAGILNDGTLTLTNSTVSENSGVYGGGIYNFGTLTLTNSTVSGNAALQGAGIDNEGTLTLTDTTVSGNMAQSEGGGIANLSGTLTLTNGTVSGNTALMGNGGGVTNILGTLTLTNSTVSGNTGAWAGGINNYTGTLTLTNSTVSGNTTLSKGGGIANYTGPVTLTNSTVSGNTADEAGGGIFNLGPLTLTNSLVDGDCEVPEPGVPTSKGYNVESPGNTCGFDQPTDQINDSADDLKLGPLQVNGGPTETHALGEGSVAIDVIPEAECVDAEGDPLTEDQRAEPRPGGSMCDVGSFELQPEP